MGNHQRVMELKAKLERLVGEAFQADDELRSLCARTTALAERAEAVMEELADAGYDEKVHGLIKPRRVSHAQVSPKGAEEREVQQQEG